jgi:very-short-patch-repair endonuclease
MRAKIIREGVLRDLYEKQGLSLRKIADKLGRPLSTITNYMKKYGISRRTKSEAQSSYLSNNEHPMQGRVHSQETKQKISSSLGEFWDSLSEAERQEYRTLMGSGWRNKWESMSDGQRASEILKLNNASRAKQGKGSRFENFVAEQLRKRGFTVEERTHSYMPSARFEVDIALAKEKIMIEIDGPTHFINIYGQESFEKQQVKDRKKNRYLTNAGFHVLRVRDNNGPLSQIRIDRIVETINNIKSRKTPKVHIMEN